MKYFIIIPLIFLFTLCSQAVFGSDDFYVKSKVDKKTIDINEILKLIVEIQGSFQRTPDIIIPKLDNFEIISTSTMSNFSFDGKTIKNSLDLIYFLRPIKNGKLVIPEIKVKYNNKNYITAPIEIEVTGRLPKMPNGQPEEKIIENKEQLTL